MIPLVDVAGQYTKIREEIARAIDSVFTAGNYIDGDQTRALEREFAKAHGLTHAAGCDSGTAALFLALLTHKIGPGDEVITVANSFMATAGAICNTGAKPVFVDMDPTTYQMDLKKVSGAITPKTKAIVPVHLYGNVVPMDALNYLAKKYQLAVVEDAAQAHLASYRGKKVGAWGNLAAFSFYPGKNLGAYGDAGIVTCPDEASAKLIRSYANHGRYEKKYEHDRIGFNYRMDELQAAMLRVKLNHLEKWTQIRKQIASTYNELFDRAGIQRIQVTPEGECVYHLYVVEVSNRDEVMEHLKSKGIASGIHYPIPLHLQPALKHLGYEKGAFPAAEKAANRILSLPICGELTPEKAKQIAETFLQVAKS